MHKQTVCVCVYLSSTFQNVSGALAAGLGTGCRCLGSTVHLLHRSRWLSLQAGKLRCAMRAVWHSYWGKLWVFHPSFHSQLNVWLSRVQGLYQDIAGTMGSSQTNCSHNYSSEWNSPSLTVKDWGLCFTCSWLLFSFCCLLTPVYRDKKSLGPQTDISLSFYLHEFVHTPIFSLPQINEIS